MFDYSVIGGGLSLLAIGMVVLFGCNAAPRLDVSLPLLYLFFNSAHFAASTVRLYTKRGAFESLPLLTMAGPLATTAVLVAGLHWPGSIGYAINKLYLTWSPFHYAATAYGLALIYSYRSGCAVSAAEKRLVRAASLLPFVYALLLQELGGIEGWIGSARLWSEHPTLQAALGRAAGLVGWIALAAPVYLAARPWIARRPALPLMVPLVLAANGVWWVVFTSYTNAFNLATIFHGVQYLAIVSIFHVKERVREPGNTASAARHAVVFYLSCLVLAVALFQFWPYAFVLAGFGKTESVLLVIAVINIHHFVVDAYIWKLRADPNYQNVVVAAPPLQARAQAR